MTFLNEMYKPDVLSCIANLSSDEVFTPPEVANDILDTLPQELFKSSKTKFLDPCCKSGVFLREIAKRLIEGLKDEIPDLEKRLDHIFKNQLYGIAITELTSLLSRRSVYCSKDATSEYSVVNFSDVQGNILYKRINHIWFNKKCIMCGASQDEYSRGDILETYAYQFIHMDEQRNKNDYKRLKDMKFDVIIGNPPYQMSDGGGMGTSAIPIYDKFVQQAKRLNPRYITMIIPSRWFSGGKGLDNFRNEMLSDNRLRIIHDYIEAADCFPGVQIKGGVCYFLWDRDNEGLCSVTTHKNGKSNKTIVRPLLEEGCETFIRFNEAIEILQKVREFKEKSFENLVSPRRPFGIDSDVAIEDEEMEESLKIYAYPKNGYINKKAVKRNANWVNSYKVFISKAGSGSDSFPHQILGVPFFGDKNTVCTETFLVIGPYKTQEECENVISYIKTKFFRFLVLLKKSTQNAAKGVYSFVPIQNFNENWTDEKLYEKYGISDEEIEFIDSMIRPME